MHKRALYAIASVLGKEGTLVMNSGEKFTGRLFTYVNEGLILKSCSRFLESSIAPGDLTTQMFMKGTFESLSFSNVTPPTFRKFKTDTQISNSNSGKARNLQKWEGEGEGEALNLDEGDSKFDQFLVNEIKFGVKSDYREEYYTTTKVNERELTEEQRLRAERVEREILSKVKVDEYVEDEEACFSAVLGHGRFSDRKPIVKDPSPTRRFRGKAKKEIDRRETKPKGLVVEVPVYVPDEVKALFTPLSSGLPSDSLTSLYLEGASFYTSSRLDAYEWTSDLID